MDAKDHLIQTNGSLMATHINTQAGGATHLVKNYGDERVTHLKKTREGETMKLRARIELDLVAEDLMEAKRIIDDLEKDMKVFDKYKVEGDINLSVKERRGIRSQKRDS